MRAKSHKIFYVANNEAVALGSSMPLSSCRYNVLTKSDCIEVKRVINNVVMKDIILRIGNCE